MRPICPPACLSPCLPASLPHLPAYLPASPACITCLQVGSEELLVERLEEDAANQVWLVGHGPEERVPLAAVRCTLEADYLQVRRGEV